MLEQEDIGFPHFRITQSLAFIGVILTASWQKTPKENNNELLARVKSTIGAWKSGKFMPLVSRPFSVNTYCLSRIWFRTHTVDLREGDITNITSAVKQYIYQDMFEKPAELVLHRPVEMGGLGLHSVRCKALAGRLTTFLQTAANPRFQSSAFHSALYNYYCEEDNSQGVPDLPPYYPISFFNILKNVKKHTPLNPVTMSLKDWYRYLLEEEVTHQHTTPGDLSSPLESRKNRMEEQDPHHDWNLSYDLSRMRGLSPDLKSFNFKLLNVLIPNSNRTQARCALSAMWIK